MRTFAQNQGQPQPSTSVNIGWPATARFEANHQSFASQRVPVGIDDPGRLGLTRNGARDFSHDAANPGSTSLAHDFSRIPLQAKLVVSNSADPFEQEADWFAARVLDMTPQPTSEIHAAEDYKGTAYQPAEHRFSATQDQSDANGKAEAPTLVREVLNLPGEPLEPTTRAFMEPRFGFDFGKVRIHRHANAAASARAINARAYTVGQDIVLASGQYAPGSKAYQSLLAHELTHVVQQGAVGSKPVLQRKDDPATTTPAQDPEIALGLRLWQEFPNGVAVAIYADPNPWNAKPEAEQWALREKAIGTKGKTITAKDLGFSIAMSETIAPLSQIVNAVSRVLSAAAARTVAAGNPAPAAGTGPSAIRSLALFGHGAPNWMGVGQDENFFLRGTPALVKKMAASLAPNVNVMLYACGVARGQKEEETWVKGTMEGGGADSLAGVIRDALLEQGKNKATVWGHEATGNVTHNPTLREFTADAGKGAPGVSYASTFVYTDTEKAAAFTALKNRIISLEFDVEADPVKFEQQARAVLNQAMYNSYIAANKDLEFQRGSIAETAPEHPQAVAALVRKYWWETYWPANQDRLAQALIKSLKLKTTVGGRNRDHETLKD